MIDDGMIQRFPKPDIILGQHVMVGEAGTLGHRAGAILAAGDSMHIKLYGRGDCYAPANYCLPRIVAPGKWGSDHWRPAGRDEGKYHSG